MDKEQLSQLILQWFESTGKHDQSEMKKLILADPVLSKNVDRIRAIHQVNFYSNSLKLFKKINLFSINILQISESDDSAECYVYQLDETGAQTDFIEGDETIPSATHYLLPCKELDPVWDTLVYDSGVKEELLNFAKTSLLFAKHEVSEDIIGINRVVLLHGPPGTGKTTLCKALAQKLAIRLTNSFEYGQLIEINSHSLFSKWFSEVIYRNLGFAQNLQTYQFIRIKLISINTSLNLKYSLTNSSSYIYITLYANPK